MRKQWKRVLGAALLAVCGPGTALAQEAAAGGDGLVAIGAGIAIGVAAIGPGIGQGFAVASAMESIGRNPNAAERVQTPLIMGLAFMEALAIYGLVIAYFLQSKVG
ncbi:MAG: ATP synthase F0 subunit C [Candidatus Binatia bacterium]